MSAIVERIGWLLVHSLWQLTLIGLVAGAFVALLRKHSSHSRYGILTGALLVMVASPVLTWCVLPSVSDSRANLATESLPDSANVQRTTDDHALPMATAVIAVPPANVVPNPASKADALTSAVPSDAAGSTVAHISRTLDRALRPWLSAIVSGWCIGVLLFSVRPVWGLICVRRLLSTGVSSAGPSAERLLHRLCERMRIRQRVTILASSVVRSPVVVGCVRSVILVPVSLLASIPAGQLEAILAHELAHVRRWDYLVNLFHSLIETFFFYHPVVWWLSNRIRTERENCCDDVVVAVLGNRIEYGRALLAVEEFRGAAASRLAMGLRDGSLIARVRRLMAQDGRENPRSPVSVVAATLLVLGILITLFWPTTQTRAQEGREPNASVVTQDNKAPADEETKTANDQKKAVGDFNEMNPFAHLTHQDAVTSKDGTVVSSSKGGRWKITSDADLRIDQEVFHGADVMTTAVLIWHGNDNKPGRHCRLQMAADAFANRNTFTAVWETGKPVLWFVTGWPKQRGLQQEQKERVKAEQLHCVDFSDPSCIVDHSYDGWPSEGGPSEECRAKLDADFLIEPKGKETYRYYHGSLPGSEPSERDVQKIHVFLDADQRCRVSNPWADNPPESSCSIATLTETLLPVVGRFRSSDQVGLNGPLHVVVGSAPDYPESDLKAVLSACKATGVLVPQPAKDDQAVRPWRAIGRVTDGEGKPLAGVTVRAMTGIGTLRMSGSGITDENGKYDFRFGFGIRMANGEDGKPSAQTQAAIISVQLDGHFEKTFCQQGDGIASFEPLSAEDAKRWSVEPNQVFLPDKPREINFVMLPAARFSGTLIGEDDQPLKDYSVSLTGDQLPPGSEVIEQVVTDENGRFEIKQIPTTAQYQIQVRKPRAELQPPWNDSWAIGPIKFADPGENELVTISPDPDKGLFSGMIVKRLRLKIVGPGVPGKTALKKGPDLARGENLVADHADASGKLVAESLTLVLSNQIAEGRKPSGEDGNQAEEHKPSGEDKPSEPAKPNGSSHPNAPKPPGTNPDSAWLRFCPGTQIVEHTDADFVSGVVVDEEGRPIAGCSVEHPGIVGPETDDQGKFQYKQSKPHRTLLRAYHPDYRLWHGAPVPGDVLRIVLQKKAKPDAADGMKAMTVRVIDSQTAAPVKGVKVTARRYEGPENGTTAATATTDQEGTAILRDLERIQHQLMLSAHQPVPYVGTLAHPNSDELEVVMVVDRACELVLRAVDSETGKGIAGVRFDRERALAELWAEPVVSDILGPQQNSETLTDADGYARFLVGSATWSYMILKYPEGYDSIIPIAERQEVEITTPVGGKVEYTFRLVGDGRGAEKATAWKTRRPDSVTSESNETAMILDDDSVQLSLPSPNWSAPTMKTYFAEATTIGLLRLELLPDSRFKDRRLGRMPDRTLKLFEVKPSITSEDGTSRTFDWDTCSNLQTPEDDECSSLIDHATDTGWTVPPLAKDQAAHELIFQLKTPLKLEAGETLAVELDSGGSDELDTIARFRVSFPTRGEPMKADQSSLEDAALQSRLAIFANSDKGQVHAEEDQQFEKAAKAFITALSSKDPDGMFPHCSVPWCYQDELIGDVAAVRARLGEISVPGAFALAEKKKYLLLHTLEDLELLLKKKTPVEARKVWAEQLAGTSRIAVVSGGPMLLAISLRKTEQNHLASGILFAYFPKENDALLKAINEGRSQRVNRD